MCGFVTFYSNKQLRVEDIKKLISMNEALKHRGPDDEGIYINNVIFLGFRRLSIIDIENGRQPFSYDSGNYSTVFNGEIYNYIELREDLIKKGYKFSTNSEAEVILAMYKCFGEDFVTQLRGMFSFIIWDNIKQQLFGARDSFGIKPFYYVENDNGLYCASELKSFLYKEDTNYNKIDMQAFQNYLTFQYVPEPKTMFENINILEPGTIIKKAIGKKAEIYKYNSLCFAPKKTPINDKLCLIREAIEDSVNIHMRSDVPVGTFLSGGIDSSIITALTSKINPRIKTFTVGFEQKGYSEIELAKQTAYELGVENISKTISAQEFIEELPNIIWSMDGPVADPSVIPLYFIAREASKHVKVILSGEGADELFGGYNIYHEPKSLVMFPYIPKEIKKMLKASVSYLPEGIKGKSFIERGCTPLQQRYMGNAHIFNETEKSQFMKNYNKDFSPTIVTQPLFKLAENLDAVTQMQYIDINTWLKGDILVKSDRMSMAHSLELRVPFLDNKVFDAASILTMDDKINHTTTKYLLRESFKDILPSSVVARKKLGYPVPIRHWLKNEMYDWALTLIKESNTDRYLNKENFILMLEAHRKGPVDYSRRLWTILTFMLWHKIFIENQNNNALDKSKQLLLYKEVAINC